MVLLSVPLFVSPRLLAFSAHPKCPLYACLFTVTGIFEVQCRTPSRWTNMVVKKNQEGHVLVRDYSFVLSKQNLDASMGSKGGTPWLCVHSTTSRLVLFQSSFPLPSSSASSSLPLSSLRSSTSSWQLPRSLADNPGVSVSGTSGKRVMSQNVVTSSNQRAKLISDNIVAHPDKQTRNEIHSPVQSKTNLLLRNRDPTFFRTLEI